MKRLRLAALVLASVVLVPATVRAQGQSITVLTCNIHHAQGTDGRVDVARVAEAVRGADIVGLEEVDVHSARSGFIDEARVIASRLGMNHVFGETQSWLWFMKYGNAILSRYPIVSSRNHDLPRLSERRRMLQADLRVGSQVVHAFVAHLSLNQAERALQVAEIARLLARTPGRKVLVGDFNARPTFPEIATVERSMADAWDVRGGGPGYSFSSTNPRIRIDYVFVSPIGIRVDSVRVRNPRQADGSQPSDHLPVEARITVQ